MFSSVRDNIKSLYVANNMPLCYSSIMKFNLKRTILCSLAFGWIALFWGSYDSFMQIVDIDVFGLKPDIHGVIIAADNILGLILLPLFGKWSDKSKGVRFGKRKPFVIFGTITEMLGFAGVCVFASLGKEYFVPFIICLIITLASMAAYRSPALSIVPDLNPDVYRSKANAVANVVSVVTTVLALAYFYICMPNDLSKGFWVYGGMMIGTTLILLVWFSITVHESKFREEAENEQLHSSEPDELALSDEEKAAEHLGYAKVAETYKNGEPTFNENGLLILPSFDSTALSKNTLVDNIKKKSFRENIKFERFCILAVVFCFYMAYNALTSFFIKYANFVLHFEQKQGIIPLILAEISAMLAFPLASNMAGKIGRKKTIIIGLLMMILSFAIGNAFHEPHPFLYVIFVLLGVSFGLMMVNIYPFFLETTKDENLGEDTGVFSVAMTLAMAVTPILSGFLIRIADGWYGGENAGYQILFPYCILFLLLAGIFTLLIKTKKTKE